MRRASDGVVVPAAGRRVGAVALAALLAGCSAAPPRPPCTADFAQPAAAFVAPPAAEPAAEAAADPAGGSLLDLLAAQQGRDAIPPPMDTRMSYERGPSEAFNWRHFTVDAAWIPAMWVTADVDQDGTLGTRGDLDTGTGMSLRAGFGSNQQNIGVLYMGTWHDEQTTGRSASTQQLLIDFLYRAPIPEMNGLVWFEVDGGLGAVDLRFDSPALDDEVTGSALLHGDLEFRLGKALWIGLGGGAFVWGHFGDTLAYGTYVDLGVKLIF